MIKGDLKEMSNSELMLEKEIIRNEFESTKNKIKEFYRSLENLQIYFTEVEEEENKRKNKING